MKLGINVSVINNSDLARAFDLAARVGVDGISLNLATPMAVADLGRRDFARRLRSMVRRHGIDTTSIWLDCLCQRPCLIGRDHDVASGLTMSKMTMWAAAESGIEAVAVPFFGMNTIEFPHEQRRAEAALRELADEAEAVGVTLAVATDLAAEQLLLLLDVVASPSIKLALCTGRMAARRFDVAGVIRDLGQEAIVQVQMQDVATARGTAPLFDVRLGHGEVDFGNVIRALRLVNYTGWLLVEADTDETAAANVAFARGLLAGGDWLASKLARIRRPAEADELVPA